MGCSHCPVDNIIDGSMAMVLAFTPSAAEAIGWQSRQLAPRNSDRYVAGTGLSLGEAQQDGVVVHAQAQ